jgi:secreted trypsin-like serine protease
MIIRHDRADEDYRALGQRFIDLHVETRVPGRDGATGPIGNGMGTLIAPTWVLTAAHVARTFAHGDPGNRSTGDHYVTISGSDYRVARVVLHPDYVRRPSRQTDIALIELADPARNHRYAELYRETDEVGQEVIFLGSGDVGTGQTGPTRRDRRLRGATNRVDRAGPRTLYFTFDGPDSENVTQLEGISGPGDSGGGALIERDGRLYIAGVSCCQDHGGNEGLYGVTEIYPRVSFYAAWIDRVMRPETT